MTKVDQCQECLGLGTVSNYVNGINFEEECQWCKGKGVLPKRTQPNDVEGTVGIN